MSTKSFQAFTQVLEGIIRYFKWVVLFAALLIVLSGVYRVESNEAAIVLRFGRLVGNTYEEQIKKPGLHFAFPFFIDEVIKIPVQTVHELSVITHFGEQRGLIPTNVEENAYLLTGDNNVVQLLADVKFQIGNAAQFALYSRDPIKMLDGVISGELTRSVARMNIEAVLTTGRAALGQEVKRNSQVILDRLKSGIVITNIELTDIIPPRVTAVHFMEVVNALVLKGSRIQHARERASTMIFEAQAEASAYRQSAISDQNVRLTGVRNEMAEFDGIYDQFVKNPQVIIAGNFKQRAAAILAKAGGSMIIPGCGGSPIILLP